MKVPFINSDQKLHRVINESFDVLNKELAAVKEAGARLSYNAVPLADHREGIEYINYQTPALIMINFSDGQIDGFDIIKEIVADPWLNHGGIIALYDDPAVLDKIDELKDTNIIISLPYHELNGLFLKVLKVIGDNQQILFQRAIHTGFISNISGKFYLDPDVSIIPCYSNLISNYLYNLGFVDAAAKSKIGLGVTELLINAIEHGNCGITFEEKTEYLERHGSITGLIERKCEDAEIAARKVTFEYDIGAEGSTYHIEDEGDGFDWASHLEPGEEPDVMAFHGRGILLTRHSVDRLEYNEKGNAVTMGVSHRLNTTNTVPLVFRDHEVVEFEPGDLVFREGEESIFLYYIAEGEYRVEVNKKQVATIEPSDILMGEMSFLLQETRSATVIANTHGKLIKISNVAFVNSLKEQPYYGLFLAKLLAQRLYNSSHVKGN